MTKMKILVFVERSAVRGGIEVFAERHVAQLRAEGHEVEVVNDLRHETRDEEEPPFSRFDEIIVHKCSDVATLEQFPPEKTVYYVHDHEPICPRGYAYTPLKRNCTRPGGLWPCLFCAPACRSWKSALRRVFDQKRRIAAMSRFKKIVVISNFMKSRLVANGLDAAKIAVRPPTVNAATASVPAPMRGDDAPSRPIDLLYVGQLIRGKGVHLLLQAMSRMRTSSFA